MPYHITRPALILAALAAGTAATAAGSIYLAGLTAAIATALAILAATGGFFLVAAIAAGADAVHRSRDPADFIAHIYQPPDVDNRCRQPANCRQGESDPQ